MCMLSSIPLTESDLVCNILIADDVSLQTLADEQGCNHLTVEFISTFMYFVFVFCCFRPVTTCDLLHIVYIEQ